MGARRPYGPQAWLVDTESPVAWAEALGAMDVPGVIEIVPAETTVTVRCTARHHAAVGAVLDTVTSAAAPTSTGPPVTIDVVYSGPDLDALATRTGMSVGEVVRVHASATYRVAFCGFSPGFAYLRGVDPRLHVPRRDTPRRAVPAGAVGIAAGYTCVYPASSPGGWHLVGQTRTTLWDAAAEPPAVLTPGREVRFRSVPP